MHSGTTLADAIRLWPTARSEDSESCGTHPGSKGGDSLTGMLRNWPTPKAEEKVQSPEAHAKGFFSLVEKAERWPTPNAADEKTSEDYPHKRGNPTLVGASAHWPTPDAHAMERTNRSPSEGAATLPTIALAAKNWKTPHGMAGIDHTGKVGGGGEFAKQVEGWATPNVPNGGRSTAHAERKGNTLYHNGKKVQEGLEAQTKTWPSPAARDSKGENSVQHLKRTDGRTDEHESCRPASELRHAELFAPGPSDPRWGEIIAERPGLAPATQPGVRMLADGDSPAVDESRRHQLRAVGNGAVPLAAALALVVLAREAGLMPHAEDLAEVAA